MKDHELINHILDLLELLQENRLDPEILSDPRRQDGLSLDSQKTQLAWELIQFMDEMPGGFLIYHADKGERIIYANKALLRIFQCATMAEFRELTGNSFRGIVHPEDLETVEKSIANQIANSQYDLDYVEYRALRKDGATLWIEDYGHYIASETLGGIFYVFLGDATDKWNRLMAEQAILLHHQDEDLQRLLREYDEERSPIGREYLRRLRVIEGLSVNYDTILYANLDKNQVLPYRLGHRGEGILSAEYRTQAFDQCLANYRNTWVCGEDQALFSQAIDPEHIRRELSQSSSYYVNYRVSSGNESQYVQMRVVHVGKEDRVSQIVLGFRTVDEEVRREMEHRKALAEALESANLAHVARNTFLSNVSHDMRTPLNAIFGFTTLAKLEIQNTGAVQAYLDRIETASHQLLDLINKVLELAHTESGKTRIVSVECNLPQTIQEACHFLDPQAEEREIDFTMDCSGIRHPVVYSDPERLKQMVFYLTNNAFTYTPPGGRVCITVSEREELPNQYAVFQIVVSDTGTGIREEFLDRIFEPFFRAQNSTDSGIHGMGLGLSITKNIVEMMSGTIHVQSKVGQGSIFTVTLRLKLHPKSLPDRDESLSEEGTAALRILLVEDNSINLELETDLLQEMGFSVEPATNGRIALDKLSQSAPGEFNLVLMDIQMPVMDGWTAAAAIRKLENPALAQIPIIALSANVFEDDIRKSVESGMDAHLPKPIDLNLLMKTVEQLREHHRPYL